MAGRERVSRGKLMRPNYFVFCEGDTEVAYVNALRSEYRTPIQIIARKTLQNISEALIQRCKSTYIETESDMTYLMYDLDVQAMLPKLKKIPGTTLLCSNPCFELWLLLHYETRTASITSAQCLEALLKFDPKYHKGKLSPDQISVLNTGRADAIKRAKALTEFENPSTGVYSLIKDLEENGNQ